MVHGERGQFEGVVSDANLAGQSEDLQRERLLQHPMELDLSCADQVANVLSRLTEGVQEYDKVELCYMSGMSAEARNQLPNVVQIDERMTPLRGGAFYVNKPKNTMHTTVLQRAETIIDRMAELIKPGRTPYLDDVFYLVRDEGYLPEARTYTYTLLERLCRTHPRLQTFRIRATDGTKGREQIIAIHDAPPPLPETIDEAIAHAVATTPAGEAYTADEWLEIMCGDLCYTPATMAALREAIQLDPRITIPQLRTDKDATERKWPPELRRPKDFYTTPLHELARLALDTCETYDMQTKEEIIARLTAGVKVPAERQREIIETLQYDPRVHLVGRSVQYLKIIHSPEDEQKFNKIHEVVSMAVKQLLQRDVQYIDAEDLRASIYAMARKCHIKLTQHVMQLLFTNARNNRRLAYTPATRQFKVKKLKSDLRKLAAQEVSMPVVAPNEDTFEVLVERIGKDRAQILQIAVASVITELDDATISVMMSHMVTRAESVLEREKCGPTTKDEQAYLAFAFARNDMFELSEDPQGNVLTIRPR